MIALRVSGKNCEGMTEFLDFLRSRLHRRTRHGRLSERKGLRGARLVEDWRAQDEHAT
jgi:hypothetical protein